MHQTCQRLLAEMVDPSVRTASPCSGERSKSIPGSFLVDPCLRKLLGSPNNIVNDPSGELLDQPLVMVVDDEVTASELFCQRLQRCGFNAGLCSDPNDLGHILAHQKVDALLLDCIFPTTNGIDILKDLRRERSAMELPILMVTAKTEAEFAIEALEAGANDYIMKPVDVRVAAARLNAHLGMTKLHRALSRQQEVEALNAMIVTYNHEINNPLAIAIGTLENYQRLGHRMTELEPALRAMQRIATIIRKIKGVTNQEALVEEYARGTKMIRVGDEDE